MIIHRLENLDNLSNIIRKDIYKHIDGMLTSPTYLALTSRYGAKLYQDNNVLVYTCRHPNLENEYLVMPELETGNGTLLCKALIDLKGKGYNVRLARFTKDDLQKFESAKNAYIGFPVERANLVAETHLDWLFPVHIISTENVAKRTGNNFEKVRRYYNRVNNHHNISAQELHSFSSEKMISMLKQILEDNKHPLHIKVLAQDADYYTYLFHYVIRYPEHFNGLLLFENNNLIGINLWERAFNEQAVALVNIADENIKGMSIFQFVKACQTLSQSNIPLLNIGGSETQGLNDFKERTFNPIQSIELFSAEILYKSDAINAKENTLKESM